ncbi:hypothetical protein B0H10DRAFT_1964739 [Mycena sp. CBHHK59/15]|nr:hypothetical protein B0H10DRAFT_1964739 [Mycena sp. CBHHK59/15]
MTKTRADIPFKYREDLSGPDFMVLVPGAIHLLHKQTMEWIMVHGGTAVVTTSQLHSHSETPPTPVVAPEAAFATLAPVIPLDSKAEFSIPVSLLTSNTIEFENLSVGMGLDLEDSEDDSDDDVEFEFDQGASDLWICPIINITCTSDCRTLPHWEFPPQHSKSAGCEPESGWRST